MPHFALYLAERFLYRVVEFFHHWYIDASRHVLHILFSLLGNLDATFAVHITARHFFEPLYKDYSPVGRIVGIVFRSLRILIGSVVYIGIGLVFLILYIAWLLTPILIIFLILKHLFLVPTPTLLPY